MKKIVFIADAGQDIGIGDLVSALNLSKYFNMLGWESFFFTKETYAATNLFSIHNQEKVFFCTKHIEELAKVKSIGKFIYNHNIDAMFVLSYKAKLSFYSEMLSASLFKAAVHFEKKMVKGFDLILSWDHNSNLYFDERQRTTKYFIGPEYVILPISFDPLIIRQRKYKKNKENILLLMGGSDEKNFTKKIILKLIEIECELNLNIIIGSGYQYEESLFDTLISYKGDFRVQNNVKKMFQEYMACDFAIVAGGLTAFEVITTRTPAYILPLYPHQVPRCEYFEALDLCKSSPLEKIDLDLSTIENFLPESSSRIPIKIQEVVNYLEKKTLHRGRV